MSAGKPEFKVRYGIVCDDLRIEDNGKQILIGIYNGGIVLNSFPAPTMLLTLWCDVEQTMHAVFHPIFKQIKLSQFVCKFLLQGEVFVGGRKFINFIRTYLQ